MTGQALDLGVIVVYLVVVAVLGIALRGRQEGVGDYFLGSRRVAWPLILLSIVATETSSVTFLSVPGGAYRGDMAFLQLPIGYVIGRLGVAAFLMPTYFRGTVLSLYETLGVRFGRTVQRLVSAIFVVTRCLADGLRLFLTAIVVEKLSGWSLEASVFAVGVATVLYTFFGGIRAVIWTDVLQFVVYIAGAIVAWCILVGRLSSESDGTGGVAWIMAAGHEAGKLRVFHWSIDFTKTYTFWSGLVGGAILTAATHGADQMMVQRYLCTNSVRHARLALVGSAVVVLVQFGFFLLIGVGLWAFYEQIPPDEAFVRPDDVFATFISREVPAGLRGLIVAAVLAAAMSTLSSSLNSVASAIVADFYCPLARRAPNDPSTLRVSRMLTVIIGGVQMAVGIAGQFTKESTVDNVLKVAGFTTGLILGVLVLGHLVRRASEPAAVVALVTGAVVVTLVWWFTPVAWTWYTLVGSGVTLLAGTAVSVFNVQKTSERGSCP
jgi:SSS family transporter